MSEPRTPQVPMVDGNGEPFYPLTQYNQIVMPDGSRWDGKGGGAQIDDTSASTEKVYSSQKTQYELDQLSQQKADKSGWTADKFIGTDANGSMTVKDAPKSDPLDKFEIGVIYHFAIDVNPPEKYGGYWEKINGRILIGTGTPEANSDGTSPGSYNYGLNIKGGEAEVALTVEQIASHAHNGLNYYGTPITMNAGNTGLRFASTPDAGYGNNEISTNKAGGDEPHNNMPPWLAVNMWKRVS